MNDAEVNRQIQQMVKFIKQEADEKASEIAVSAEEEFNIEKLQLMEAEKQKVRREYERKEGQFEVKKKIEYSTQLNAMRLDVLKKRQQMMDSLFVDAKAKVAQVTQNPAAYKALLIDLMMEGAKKLEEKAVLITARECDVPLVKEAASAAGQRSKGVSYTLNTASFLPPPPVPGSDATSCIGGIKLTSTDGRIGISQTLDARLSVAFESNLPTIRAEIFTE